MRIPGRASAERSGGSICCIISAIRRAASGSARHGGTTCSGRRMSGRSAAAAFDGLRLSPPALPSSRPARPSGIETGFSPNDIIGRQAAQPCRSAKTSRPRNASSDQAEIPSLGEGKASLGEKPESDVAEKPSQRTDEERRRKAPAKAAGNGLARGSRGNVNRSFFRRMTLQRGCRS